jgi:hypothetical protein
VQTWIEQLNPFNLARPGEWWLKLLHDYDDQLRVFWSQKEPAFRLARVVRREARLGLSAMTVHQHPDTVIMIQHGCVPVSTLVPWAVQSDKVIRDLMARDLWRNGGADKTVDQLEAQEAEEEARQDRNRLHNLDHLNGDAFRSLKQRKGERLVLSDANRGRHKSSGVGAVTVRLAQGATNSFFDRPVARTDHNPVSSLASGVGKPRPGAPFGGITLTDAG